VTRFDLLLAQVDPESVECCLRREAAELVIGAHQCCHSENPRCREFGRNVLLLRRTKIREL
jgi:hypothetical protein